MTFIVSAKQIVIMFLLMLLGFLTGRLGMIHKETAKDLTNFLLYIISPCLIVNAYLVGFSMKRLIEFFQAIVAVTLVYSVSIIVSHLIINKKFFKDQETRSVLLYGSAYSNAGFMGIPLVSAILGESAVFFSVPYLVVCNFFMWTHGVALFSIEHKRSLRLRFLDALKNPNVIAAFIGFIIFVSGIKLPELVLTPIKSLVSVNTPLSMVVVGTNLGAISFSGKKKSQDGRVRNFCQKHPDSADLPVYFAQRADFRSGCLGDSYHGFLSGSCRCCFIFIAEQF